MVKRGNNALNVFIWFPSFLAFIIVLLPAFAKASVEYGLQRTVYNYNADGLNTYNNAPPLPGDTGIEPSGTDSVPRIEENFDQYPPFGLYDDFLVHYVGYITAPVSGNISFWPQGDDGTKLSINGVLVQNDWIDKGSGGAVSDPVEFTKDLSFTFEFWFYENSGGAWVSLYWDIGNGWEIVPDSAFTMSAIVNDPTTTTNAVEITTTTTLPQIDPIGTCGPYAPFTVTGTTGGTVWGSGPYTDDSNFSAAAVHAGLIKVGETATIEPYAVDNYQSYEGSYANGVYTNDWRSSWCGYKIKLLDEQISTTTVPEISSTTTTIPYVETTTTSSPPDTPQTTLAVEPSTTVPTEIPRTTTTTVLSSNTTVSSKPIPSVITVPEKSIIPQNNLNIDNGSMSNSDALVAASNPEVLSSISTDNAEVLFKSIDESSLTEAEAAAIVNAVQNAPEEIRNVFEDTVDLFSGQFDSYKMVGQTVSVGQRRTIVAVNLVTGTIGAAVASGGLSGSGGGGSPGRDGGPGDANRSSRKEDEPETEMAGEISGDGVGWINKLSIYTTIDGERVLDWKAFIKKFWFGIMNLGFTIAGSVVVYFTLSGKIQTIALISTVMAVCAAMYLHMKEPE